MKDVKAYLIGVGIGIALAVAVVLVAFVFPGARLGAKLTAELSSADRSLASAQDANRQLAASNTKLQQQLNGANSQLADAQRLVNEQQQELAGQQQLLDRQKQGLADIAQSVSNAGGDLLSTARAIASGFDRLYAIYHPGPENGKGT